jgi:hypothetical protein
VTSPVKKRSRSGTTRSYAERRDAGRPIVNFSLSSEVDALIDRLAVERKMSRSALVELAVRLLGADHGHVLHVGKIDVGQPTTDLPKK